jgi:hypothetical protein
MPTMDYEAAVARTLAYIESCVLHLRIHDSVLYIRSHYHLFSTSIDFYPVAVYGFCTFLSAPRLSLTL